MKKTSKTPGAQTAKEGRRLSISKKKEKHSPDERPEIHSSSSEIISHHHFKSDQLSFSSKGR